MTTLSTIKQARISRYNELATLRSLPFLSEEQASRVKFLEKQIPLDNKQAFKEHLAAQISQQFNR